MRIELARTGSINGEMRLLIGNSSLIMSTFEPLREVEDEIRENHAEKEAEAILTILSLVSSKAIDRNTRFAPLDTGKDTPQMLLAGSTSHSSGRLLTTTCAQEINHGR